jgi:hypothetical protein
MEKILDTASRTTILLVLSFSTAMGNSLHIARTFAIGGPVDRFAIADSPFSLFLLLLGLLLVLGIH